MWQRNHILYFMIYSHTQKCISTQNPFCPNSRSRISNWNSCANIFHSGCSILIFARLYFALFSSFTFMWTRSNVVLNWLKSKYGIFIFTQIPLGMHIINMCPQHWRFYNYIIIYFILQLYYNVSYYFQNRILSFDARIYLLLNKVIMKFLFLTFNFLIKNFLNSLHAHLWNIVSFVVGFYWYSSA